MAKRRKVFQFKVTLRGIEPQIWRRILVPSSYTFWDLHVAIQDAMGWLDYHLHAFHLREPGCGGVVEVGIPVDDGFDDAEPHIPGWEVAVASYFKNPCDVALYLYDFGDGWEHEVVFESTVSATPRKRYPVCLAGERACPPEDCGGVPGYEDLLETLRDPSSDQYEEMMERLGLRFDAEAFDAAKVKFDNPKKRWITAFAEGSF